MPYSGILMWSIIIIVCVITRLIIIWIPRENNVCRTLSDYMSINTNDNCWYNPDVNSSAGQIASRYGHVFEEHYVTSEDGYILHLYRIIPKTNNSIRQPLLLKPGMGGAPELWMMQGAKSIAFQLSDNGYDVWLSSIRGGTVLNKEETLSKSEPKYWDFSFHEIGIYDLPALTNYILRITKSDNKIIFIGHSMSTTASYIYFSERKEHAEKHLKGVISLAPAAYLRSMDGFFKFIGPKNVWLWPLTKMLRWHAFGQYSISRKMGTFFCSQYPGVYGCYYFYGYASGFAPNEERADLVPMFYSYMPTTISMQTLMHFGQMIETGRFQKIDYRDDAINLEKYNSTVPPEYNITKISVPVHLFVGKYDYNCPEVDVNLLHLQLKKNGVRTSKRIFEFAHSDFFLGKNLDDFHESLLEALNDLTMTNSVY